MEQYILDLVEAKAALMVEFIAPKGGVDKDAVLDSISKMEDALEDIRGSLDW